MPVFDLSCGCGWTRLDTYVVRELPACPECGAETFKLWRSFPALIDDTISETIHNLGPQPITFTSRSEKRLYLKSHGIREQVRHIGVQGSDKNPHTQKWY